MGGINPIPNDNRNKHTHNKGEIMSNNKWPGFDHVMGWALNKAQEMADNDHVQRLPATIQERSAMERGEPVPIHVDTTQEYDNLVAAIFYADETFLKYCKIHNTIPYFYDRCEEYMAKHGHKRGY
jgi:hypothetical protein